MHYGSRDWNSLHLFEEYFTHYLDYASQVLISVKGGYDLLIKKLHLSRNSLERCDRQMLRITKGKKYIDIFQPARPAPKIDVTDVMVSRCYMVDSAILAEVNATIRVAHEVRPLKAVEVEFLLLLLALQRMGF
ncbi:hypothetical protein K469DRAFT_800077 [Zopfia rhizophila CBS 207.26]|uniref:Uncharacterized protein n=1 Tax=Zopfia rhizophila CBS 207.26 TaxID=1314779 RepID=A0A6A6EM04_9PEZI|nr:hypothetical protein K469DRAFT_800077 [Zopfia rhizophila CBS 207.26]